MHTHACTHSHKYKDIINVQQNQLDPCITGTQLEKNAGYRWCNETVCFCCRKQLFEFHSEIKFEIFLMCACLIWNVSFLFWLKTALEVISKVVLGGEVPIAKHRPRVASIGIKAQSNVPSLFQLNNSQNDSLKFHLKRIQSSKSTQAFTRINVHLPATVSFYSSKHFLRLSPETVLPQR